MSDQGKIVLFFPTPIDEWDHRIELPLSIMTVAGPLAREGYQTVLFDQRMEDDLERRILEAVDGAVCFGISSMTGYQLVGGIKYAKLIKKRFPEIPIVWGGYHPSLRPEETIRSPYVDIVVKGQGEATFTELVHRLSAGERPDGTLGLIYKNGSEVVDNPERPLQDINDIMPMPYHLFDVDRAMAINQERFGESKRTIEYHSSQGCPFRCGYCADARIFQRRWRGIAPQRVVDELEQLISTYRLDQINFSDANFFVDERRTTEICRGIIERGLKFGWVASSRTDQLVKLKPETLELAKKAGCLRVIVGAESGCPKILKLINKDAAPEDTINSARILRDVGIKATFTFIVGFPHDPGQDDSEEISKTLGAITQTKRIHADVKTKVFYFTPYPGTSLYPISLQHGLEEPKSLEEWGTYSPITQKSKWISEREKEHVLMVNGFYLPVAFPSSKMKAIIGQKNPPARLGLGLLGWVARYRAKRSFYKAPMEWKLYKNYKKLVRKPRFLNEIS